MPTDLFQGRISSYIGMFAYVCLLPITVWSKMGEIVISVGSHTLLCRQMLTHRWR
uniref:Uncharacterized protein n=1 Tax=Anguilla anguilla TaxID=7936 RepID=A0A0E9W433_ANGAN